MSRAKVLYGLNRPAFFSESTMGETNKEFLHDGSTKIIGIEQTAENPFNPTENNNQEQIKVTRGSHIQSAKTIRNGRKDIALDVTTMINKNDFISLAYRYMPIYSYGAPVFDTTISAIVNSATYSTLTVASAVGIIKGMEVDISGRVDSAEDKKYSIRKVDGSDITISGLIDSGDLTGSFTSTLGKHTLKAQSDDCNKYLDLSSSLWLPRDFTNPSNTCGIDGELVTGLAGLAMNLDLMAATAQLTMRGKEYIRTYADQPISTDDSNTSDYLEPNSDQQGFTSTQAGVMEYYNGSEWLELDTDSLTLNIELGLNEETKVFRANKFSRVIIDGVSYSGNYGALVLESDGDNNISNAIIENRDVEGYSIIGRVKLINEDGTGFYIEGNITFMNATTPVKDLGGEVFTTDFMFTASDANPNIEMTVLNNYTTDLTTYL